jgi:transposase
MSLGQHRSQNRSRAAAIGPAPRASFYEKLDVALAVDGFDQAIEELARPCYSDGRGRRSIPPGVYFRMLFVGAIEGIASQRELAARCADSLSVRKFLGFSPHDLTPDHSTLTLLRRRLPTELHEQAFQMVLASARRHDVMRGRKLAISMPWSGTIRSE